MSMIHINGKALSKLSVSDVDSIQPNATDVRLDKVYKIKESLMLIDEETKIHRITTELHVDSDEYWLLDPGQYEVTMQGIVTMAEGEAGWVITRSTLIRNGIFLTTGLYDSGYSGRLISVLHVTAGPLKIKRGTRVGQFLLFNSESLHKYNGSYGIMSDHDKKYQ